MKIYTKLFIAGAVLFVLPFGITALFSFFCFISGLILLIIQGVTEITNKGNTPKKGKDTTPPWEK